MRSNITDCTRRCQATNCTGRKKYESAAARCASNEGRVSSRIATLQASTETKRGNDRTIAERD